MKLIHCQKGGIWGGEYFGSNTLIYYNSQSHSFLFILFKERGNYHSPSRSISSLSDHEGQEKKGV